MLIDNHYYDPNEIKGNKIKSIKSLHNYSDSNIWECFTRALGIARENPGNNHYYYLLCYKYLVYMVTYRLTSLYLTDIYRQIKDKNYNVYNFWYTTNKQYAKINTYKAVTS